MKKHLVAFLSMIGLASLPAASHAQVVKGADQDAKLKAESKIKQNKQTAEKNAAASKIQDARKDKWAKADAEHKAVKTEAQSKAFKSEASIKGEKSAAEIKANKSQAAIKQQSTMKYQKANKEAQQK